MMRSGRFLSGLLAAAVFISAGNALYPSAADNFDEYGDIADDKFEYELPIDFGTGTDDNETTLAGDLNGSGRVDVSDLIILQKVAAGWHVDFDRFAADINGDYLIDVNDLVLLQKKIAGWKV